MMTLCASASYIAVPAALRLALPEAKVAESLLKYFYDWDWQGAEKEVDEFGPDHRKRQGFHDWLCRGDADANGHLQVLAVAGQPAGRAHAGPGQ